MSTHRLSRATSLITGRVEQLFTKKGIYLRRIPHADVTLAAFLRQQCETARAILLLVRSGYGANAMGLSRSMIENWIVIRWITNQDTDSRVEEFLNFDSKLRERILQLMTQYYPGVNLDRYKSNKLHDSRAMRYKRWDTWGPRIKAMAEEPDLLDQGLSGPLSPQWAYDIPFFISSYHFHPTSLGLHHQSLPPCDRLHFKRGNQEVPGRQALMHVVHCLVLSAMRISRSWGVDIDDELSSLWTRYIEPIP